MNWILQRGELLRYVRQRKVETQFGVAHLPSETFSSNKDLHNSRFSSFSKQWGSPTRRAPRAQECLRQKNFQAEERSKQVESKAKGGDTPKQRCPSSRTKAERCPLSQRWADRPATSALGGTFLLWSRPDPPTLTDVQAHGIFATSSDALTLDTWKYRSLFFFQTLANPCVCSP